MNSRKVIFYYFKTFWPTLVCFLISLSSISLVISVPARTSTDNRLAVNISTKNLVDKPKQTERLKAESTKATNTTAAEAAYVSSRQGANANLSVNTAQSQAQSVSLTSAKTDFITIAGRQLAIFRSNSTNIDAGSRVGLIGKLLYAHNYASIFGPIGSLPAGSKFQVTLNGQTKSYTITKTVTLEKAEVTKYMSALLRGEYRGKTYDYVLMTCAGQDLGGGDASHRTLVFANAS